MDELEQIIQQYNITEGAEELQKLFNKVATIEPRTGLLNQKGFEERIQEELRKQFRKQQQYTTRYEAGLILLDLDGLKPTNDNHGYQAGNELITGSAKIIRTVYKRPTDILSSWGGDEFAIYNGGQEPSKILDRAFTLADTLNNSTINYEGKRIPFTSSIGIAFLPIDADNFQELFRKANQALKKAKETKHEKNNRIEVYAPALNRQ